MNGEVEATVDWKSNQTPETVRVRLEERSYDIKIGRQLLGETFQTCLASLTRVSHVICVYDESVQSYLEILKTAAKSASIRMDAISIPSGEASKSAEQLAYIWQRMLECKTDRSSVVVALGGGVIGDLAGFAAASFTRGLRVLQIPTTLLSMVDSSVGGKTGINLPTAKNMVGAFWQPSAVIIDTDTLNSLPEREYKSGLAEVAKYAMILDAPFFDFLESNVEAILRREPSVVQKIIIRSCELKADVVQKDERETTGLRAILNYGHTFAHAMEAATEYGTLLHGEAVAIGMAMAADLAVSLNLFRRDEAIRQNNLLERLQLPTFFALAEPSALWDLMQHDKKVENGRLGFILPTQIGHVKRHENVERELVLQILNSRATQ